MLGTIFLTGNIISAYLQTVSLATTTHVFNPYLYQKLEDDDDDGLRKYIPGDSYRKWYIPVIRNEHWTAIIVDHDEKSLTQLDTITKGIDLIQLVRGRFNRIGYLQGYSLLCKQPIVQIDGYSCGIHVIDLFLRDNANCFEGRLLTRAMVSRQIHRHFGTQPVCSDKP